MKISNASMSGFINACEPACACASAHGHRYLHGGHVGMQRVRGFTLVEVMVAMAVVAVALPALLFALNQQIDGTATLRERSLASWVASNRLAETRLVVANTGRLPSGTLEGESTLADRDWFWWVEQEGTEVPGFRRVEIRVSTEQDPEQPAVYTLVAFLAVEDERGVN